MSQWPYQQTTETENVAHESTKKNRNEGEEGTENREGGEGDCGKIQEEANVNCLNCYVLFTKVFSLARISSESHESCA